VTLSHRVFPRALPAADPARYLVVTLDNGAAEFPLRAHLYDLGAERGFRLVGLERPEESFAAVTAGRGAR
jgi:hypothetical protein